VTAELLFLYCPTCTHESLAEAPPCPDGHGAQCPDRACVECGAALLVDAPLFAAELLGAASSVRVRPAA
jgi:hypothetical protein